MFEIDHSSIKIVLPFAVWSNGKKIEFRQFCSNTDHELQTSIVI